MTPVSVDANSPGASVVGAVVGTVVVDTIMDYGRGLVEELKKVRNTDEVRPATRYDSTREKRIMLTDNSTGYESDPSSPSRLA